MDQKKKIRVPDFTPREYQLPFLQAMDSGIKRAVLVHHRRAGKEIVCWNYMIREAVCGRVGTYCYFFPTSRLGKRILWDGANKDGKRFVDYIPNELIRSENSVEMKIELVNGSVIQIMGTDQIINVGINPIGCVFSEFSLQDPKSWSFVRPILRENDGWAVFNYCVKKGTLVISENGLQKIEDVVNPTGEFTECDKKIYGLGGFHKADQFYSGGVKDLIKITTSKGYTVECTPNHQLWNGVSWVRTDQWVIGEKIPIQLDQDVFGKEPQDLSGWIRPIPKDSRGNWKSVGDNFLDIDMFYLMGLYLAEGSSSPPGVNRGGSITITSSELEIKEFINSKGFVTQKDGIHHVYCGTELHSFFMWFGLSGTAKTKKIPDRLLSCRKDEVIAFLQGYFDGDGTVSKKPSGCVKVTSSSNQLLSILQILLLNFGVVTRLSSALTGPTKRVKVQCLIYNLEMEGHFAYRFMDRIGFRLSRKQANISNLSDSTVSERGDIVPTDPDLIGWYPKSILTNPCKIRYRTLHKLKSIRENDYIKSLINDGFYWDSIKSIDKSSGEVFDFVIPETHSFFSNGVISHNTPRGKNHAYDLYLMAKDNDDWFCQLLSIEDTGVLSLEDIEMERREGMSENLIQQEYFCKFDQGNDGAFYAKYLNQAEKDERVTNVPYDPYAPVDTYWDLGVSDSTTILFVQNVGNQIHIIDTYSNEGEGLDHYARTVDKKAKDGLWQYGSHYAPHDIKVRELGHGARTRLQMAKDLGLNFEIVPNLSIHEGIEMVRSIWHRLWVDKKKCSYFLKCAENYHRVYNERLNVFSDKPCHDFSSHYMDSLRYLGVIQNKNKREKMTEDQANEYEKLYSTSL